MCRAQLQRAHLAACKPKIKPNLEPHHKSKEHWVENGWRAVRSCDVPTSRPALERAEGVPWGLIPQLWYDDAKVRRPTCPLPFRMRALPNPLRMSDLCMAC